MPCPICFFVLSVNQSHSKLYPLAWDRWPKFWLFKNKFWTFFNTCRIYITIIIDRYWWLYLCHFQLPYACFLSFIIMCENLWCLSECYYIHFIGSIPRTDGLCLLKSLHKNLKSQCVFHTAISKLTHLLIYL